MPYPVVLGLSRWLQTVITPFTTQPVVIYAAWSGHIPSQCCLILSIPSPSGQKHGFIFLVASLYFGPMCPSGTAFHYARAHALHLTSLCQAPPDAISTPGVRAPEATPDDCPHSRGRDLSATVHAVAIGFCRFFFKFERFSCGCNLS